MDPKSRFRVRFIARALSFALTLLSCLSLTHATSLQAPSKTPPKTVTKPANKPVQVYEPSDEQESFVDVVKIFRPAADEPTAVNFKTKVGLYYVPVGNSEIAESLMKSFKENRKVTVGVDSSEFIRSAQLHKAAGAGSEGGASDEDKELQKLMKQMLGN